MSTAQPSFTPGPWTVGKVGTIYAQSGENGWGCTVAEAYGGEGTVLASQQDANARLIAASPSLYAYAKASLMYIGYANDGKPGYDEVATYLRSLGWNDPHDDGHMVPFIHELGYAALALAEGGGK